MKILFVAVFDTGYKSTNNSQLRLLKEIGCDVVGYNYRQRAQELGLVGRDKHLLSCVRKRGFDWVLISKGNGISSWFFTELSAVANIALWWMDPLSTLNQHEDVKTGACFSDVVLTGVKNTVSVFQEISENVFFLREGFDPLVDFPHPVEKINDVIFIGSFHSDRQKQISKINHKVINITNAFGKEHAKEVSKAKISLNFSTTGGASDRVYKTLAAGGFLLSSDWLDREKDFEDGKDLVIFKDLDDLNDKIEFYLTNDEIREKIASHGVETVQKFSRRNWAMKVFNILKEYNGQRH